MPRSWRHRRRVATDDAGESTGTRRRAAFACVCSAPPAQAGRLTGGRGRDEAIATLERALAQAPGDALIHNSLGACLIARGERERAISAFRRASELAPDLVQSWQNLSLLLFAEQRVEEALAAVDEVLARAPHMAGVRVHRGAMLLSLGRIDDAIAEYRRAGEENPHIVGPWLGLGGIKHYRFSDTEAERLRNCTTHAKRLGARQRPRRARVRARTNSRRSHARYAEAFGEYRRGRTRPSGRAYPGTPTRQARKWMRSLQRSLRPLLRRRTRRGAASSSSSACRARGRR